MLWFWPHKKRLRIRLLGPRSELLDHRIREVYGSESFKSGVNLYWSARGLQMLLRSDATVYEGERESFKNASDREIWLNWKDIPKKLSLRFPNFCELQIELETHSEKIPYALRNAASVAGLVLLTHLVLLATVFFGAKDSLDKALSRLEERTQIISAQLEFPSLPKEVKPAPSGDPSSNDNAVKNLISQWDPGRALEPWEKLAPEKEKQRYFGQGLDSQNAQAWKDKFSVDDMELSESTLNISEAEIAKAFYPLTPRIKECYDDVLIRDRSLKGRPKIWLDINQAGRVASLQVKDLSASKPESLRDFQTCLEKAYAKVKLPQPNQSFNVTYSLVLHQANAQL